ncbi:hypothetical protein Mal15_46900 [Stieleria maiorica]|uniref:SMI1/KNR4 family protein n=1 Tax=Stieleria maiorica TaxID=2795974 RepID=A0A5B9MHL5_9BACT|nr:SMI1/KNR4 family protein [Stieleria maiorica]QEG00619.1 hypothetical protein Mal15_46900 [Stieleria maiorica]
MKKKILELLPYLGLETVEPYDDASRQSCFGQLKGNIPKDVEAFYSITDGGEIPSIECRFYGLDEALELAEEIREMQTSLPLLPVFEASGEASDPCCVLLGEGLAGTIVQLCHDVGSRVHAPSFLDFLTAITETEEGPLAASDHKFCFPKRLTKKEKLIALKLLDLSSEPVDPDSPCVNAEYEPELLIALAQSMTTPQAMPELFDPLDLKDGRARHKAAVNLYYCETPAANAKLENYCRVMNDFARSLRQALASDGHKLSLKNADGIVPTTWLVYRNRQVLVDDVYSTAASPKCWEPMRQWIQEMDELLGKFED